MCQAGGNKGRLEAAGYTVLLELYQLARRAGKRQPGQAGGDKGRLEAARINS